jgi:hypothetical protein
MSAAHQQRMRRRLAAFILMVAGGLSACASPETGAASDKPAATPPATTNPSGRAPSAIAALPRPTRKPTPPEEPSDTAAPPRDTQVIDPGRVIGLNEGDAEEWLGEPTERKDAPPATIWRYVRQDCEVEIYFYLDLQQRIMRALHYEVRGNDSQQQRSERCFQQLVSERRERDGGAIADPAR